MLVRVIFATCLLILCALSGLVAGGLVALLPHRIAVASVRASLVAATPTIPPQTTPILAQGDFHRLDQPLWGVASDGQTWGADANALHVFSMANGTGQIANGVGPFNAVLGPTGTNVEVVLSGRVNQFAGGANLGAVVRWRDPHDWYKAFIDGTHLVLLKCLNGTAIQLASTPFRAQGGIAYRIRLRANGAALFVKVWPSRVEEPTAWMLIASDLSLTSGQAGIRVVLQRETIMQIVSFQATNQ